MADEIKIEITRREAIKPCSPTPQHLRIVKLSLLDQIMMDLHVPIILFYPFITTVTINTSHYFRKNPIEIASERLEHLKQTLSKALVLYYPFAGRITDNLFIECSDDGVEFTEARAAFSILEILQKPDPVTMRKLIPTRSESRQQSPVGLLLVQATIFDCGGMAICLSFSHKISDACTIGGFIRNWAKIAQQHNPDQLVITQPVFGRGCDIFPPIQDISASSATIDNPAEKYQKRMVTRRIVFSAEKIVVLKKKGASDDHVKNPTRVEVVSGLLWKCVMKARGSPPKMSIWAQAINMRKRIVPPFGDNVVGNMSCFSQLAKEEDQENSDLQAFVHKFRKGIKEASEILANKDSVLGYVQDHFRENVYLMFSDEINYYGCTSWCRFGLYEADFGWEKPTWESPGCFWKNSVVLMDTRDGGGIEAWLTLSEQDMASIETNEDLLAFASLNPSVI